MSYTITNGNFSMFAKQLTKNLKEKNPSLKLSEVQEAISKTIGFNNFHCAKKQEFNNENELICLTPFNNIFSQVDLAFECTKKNIKILDSVLYTDFENMKTVISNAMIANLILAKEQPEKYKIMLSDWFLQIEEEKRKIKRLEEEVKIEELFSVFIGEIQKESRKELLDFILKKLNKESDHKHILIPKLKLRLAVLKSNKNKIVLDSSNINHKHHYLFRGKSEVNIKECKDLKQFIAKNKKDIMCMFIERCKKDGVMSKNFIFAVNNGAEIYSENVVGWTKEEKQSVEQVKKGVLYKVVL